MPSLDISYLLESAPSVQIIRMRNAQWVIPFLFSAFKTDNVLSIPEPGLINAGVYMLRRDVLDAIPSNRAVSLEEETFPGMVARRELFAWQVEARFIDIGTPESHQTAQSFFDGATK